MNIKFCGAAQFVTGSSHLITLDSGYKILLDCGLFQGRGKDIWDWNNTWHFVPSEIDCVILSHGHIDHIGRLPQLVKDGFNGTVYSTHATRSLCSIMLLDSAKIQESDVEWYNKKLLKKKKTKNSTSKKLREPLYTSEDVSPTMDLFIGCNYEKWIKVNDEVSFLYRDAGHILGSASVTLKITENGKETMVGFSGDIGRPNRPILRDPKPMPELDYLICESTYGDREHEDAPAQSEKLLNIIKEVHEKQGKLIIPAFSVGRTQEIVYMLDQMETQGLLPKLPIYVDSPLAVNATMIFGAHPECFDNDLNQYLLIDDNPFGFNNLNYIKHVEDSKQLNSMSGPMIIISSSGMMNAGRVKHHLYNNIENPNATLLLVGYAAPYTPAGILKTGVEELKLFGEMKDVNITIKEMDSFSAHADRKEIVDFIKNQKKLKKIFLVHGEPKAQESFKTYLGEHGFNDVLIPKKKQKFVIHEDAEEE